MKFVLLLGFFVNLSFAAVVKYNALPGKSVVGFSITKFKIGAAVNGSFKEFTGTFQADAEKKEINQLEASVAVASINTQDEKRDKHLLDDPEFFHAANYPNMKFVASAPIKANSKEIKGNLTIKNTTKPVTLKIRKMELTPIQLILQLEGDINRTEFGVVWNKALEKSDWKTVGGILGKFVLDETVQLNIRIEAQPEKTTI